MRSWRCSVCDVRLDLTSFISAHDQVAGNRVCGRLAVGIAHRAAVEAAGQQGHLLELAAVGPRHGHVDLDIEAVVPALQDRCDHLSVRAGAAADRVVSGLEGAVEAERHRLDGLPEPKRGSAGCGRTATRW